MILRMYDLYSSPEIEIIKQLRFVSQTGLWFKGNNSGNSDARTMTHFSRSIQELIVCAKHTVD